MPELRQNQIRELIDPHCDAFEAAWQNGECPQLRDYTAKVPDGARSQLFAELLGTELELRSQAGETPAPADYQARFPEYAAQIMRTFHEHDDWLTETQHTAADIADVDTSTAALQTWSTQIRQMDADASRDDNGRLPDAIGRYRIQRRLGRGGMGEVLLADDPTLNRQVAIKLPVFAPHNRDELLARFQREAQAMAKVRHANLCPIHEIGEHEGGPYLAMAYIDGQSLSETIASGKRFLPAEAVELVRTLARAIAAAHRAGVIHRDLKPGNVMIDDQGVPLITDFGLARTADSDLNSVSASGTQVGTPTYMSPEQVNGDPDAIGPTTDVYALGVILYELLTGKPPFTGKGLAVLGQIASGNPPRPPSEIADVSRRLDSLCLKAMSFDQANRYQTADELAEALDELPPAALMARPQPKVPIRTLAAIVLLLPAVIVLLQSLTVRTSTGEVMITAAEGTDVRVELRSGSDVVGVLGPDNGWKLQVDSGEYKVLMLSSDFELNMKGDTVVVSQNGVAEVTIQHRSLPPTVPEFPEDYALEFPGTGSFVHAPGVNRSGDEPITLEAWVCPTAYGTDPTVIARVHGPAVLQLARSSNNFWGWDGKTPLPFVDAIHQPYFAPRYETGKWYHVAIVADEESTTMFVSGLLCWNLPRNQAPDPGDGEGLYIAGHPWAGAVRYFFTGLIDELRVSAVCRYGGNFEPERRFEPDEHTVALYHFDAGSGAQLFDASGNEHHGTVVGASWRKLEEPVTSAPTGPFTQSFRAKRVNVNTSFSTRGILKDFDGDGDLDAFLANYDAPDSVLWNDGDGGFSDSGQQIGNSKSVGIAFGDLDGDGDPDAYVPNVGAQPNSVYLNEGAGIFTDTGQTLGESGSKAAVLIDFDQDGDLDAFVANYDWGAENRLYLNDGSGHFAESDRTYGDSPSYGLVLADLDGDGDQDIFVANGKGRPNRIYLNAADQELRDSGQLLGESFSVGAAVGDVDGDGDQDLVVANRTINKVWLNDGAGIFSDSGMDFEPQDSWHVSLGDIDGDGDPDVFVSNHGYNSVWFNDGSGRFENPEYYHDNKTHYAELKDVDSDGDLDVFLVNEDGPVRLWLNKRLSK